MFQVGDAVVVSGGRAGREGDKDFIMLKDGCYWWHGIIEDTAWQIDGWSTPLIRVRYGKYLEGFYTGQVHTEDKAMARINEKDVFQKIAENRTPTEKRVARYAFDVSVEKIRGRLEGLKKQIQFGYLLERRNVELVAEYNALHAIYRRRTRQGI